MIEWAAPWWFLALPLALAAPWLSGRPAVAFSALSLLAPRRTFRLMIAWLPALLSSIGLALLVAALARPQLVDRERVIETEGLDIFLVLDTSGSMDIADYTFSGSRVSRLYVAREVIADFVEGRPDDRVGLVVFGEEALAAMPLTLDHSGMSAYVRQIPLGMAGQRATVVGDAIAIASQNLVELEAESRLMILVTDGRSNAGQIDPLEAASAAAALGIRIYTIGIGASGEQGGLFGMFSSRGSDLDEESLSQIASMTGGQYFRAETTRALRQVYETIDDLEKTTAESVVYVHTEERFAPWLVGGLVLLLLSTLLGETWLRRLP
ncbi:MAG: VWA domain-containing protein [Myxococcota bacterium]|nr:VWA domain-containing protein [Myxococcota bacterium]